MAIQSQARSSSQLVYAAELLTHGANCYKNAVGPIFWRLFHAPSDYSSNHMRNAYYQRVAHAEGALDIGHARVRPALGEPLQLVQLVRNQPAVAAVPRLHNMFAP